MKRILSVTTFILILLTGICFAGEVELSWDNGVAGGDMQNCLRGVWFTMPDNGQIITGRFYLSGDAGYDDPFDVMLTPRRDDNGMPDEDNPYGVFNYAGGEATGAGWIDVDISSLDVNLSVGDEFYLIFDPQPAGGTPHIHYDSGSDGSHNAYRTFSGDWSESVLNAYMMRVVVEGDTINITNTSLGNIKALFE
jgi:hypothetical protein